MIGLIDEFWSEVRGGGKYEREKALILQRYKDDMSFEKSSFCSISDRENNSQYVERIAARYVKYETLQPRRRETPDLSEKPNATL